MPGTRLSKTEKDLLQLWKKSGNFPYPVLSEIHIEGNPGLRGIQKLDIKFDYPLTVICGKNGCNKTTILALAALGFHSPPGHCSINARRNQKKGQNFNYYTFSDFFYKGLTDPDITGVKITWKYGGGKEPIKIEKSSKRWMHYERRYKRPVHYLGLIRTIPAIEQSVLRSHFKNQNIQRQRKKLLNAEYCQRLSDIMCRTYSSAEVISSSRYSLRTYQLGNASPSSFNMGAGEDILIDLLYLLQESPEGSLIVIEEIEIGLHPEALIRLAKNLQEIILSKKLQIIVSTHSRYFIDSVPREARLLIQKAGDKHIITKKPTTRLAIGEISGQSEPELKIYCEDSFAALLIEHSLSASVRKRVQVIPVGTKAELPKQAAFHLLAGFGEHILLLWDGDVPKGEVNKWLQKNFNSVENSLYYRVNWDFIPGNEPPEKWVINKLDCQEGHEKLAEELKEDTAIAAQIISSLKALGNSKEISHELSSKANLSEEEATRIQIRVVSKLSSQPLKIIEEMVRIVLEGQKIPHNLVDLCHKNYFLSQGILGGNDFNQAVKSGKVDENKICQVAINMNIISSSIFKDQSYLNAVKEALNAVIS